MPPYKRQHFVPASYLRYFSIDQANCRRDSWIWRVSKTGETRVRVDSQCAANFHYSRANPEQTEQMFQVSEARYCNCIDALIAGRELSPHQFGGILMSMFDLHLRNAAHLNLTTSEGITAYNIRCTLFLNQLLLERKPGQANREEIAAHIQQHWHIRILSAPSDNVFITSDNPSAWLKLPHRPGDLHLVLLPLTPKHLAVAFDNRIVQFEDRPVLPTELAVLNGEQIANSTQCLYSSVPFQPETLDAIQNHFTHQTHPPPSETTATEWHVNMRILPPERHFSFFHYTPPLL